MSYVQEMIDSHPRAAQGARSGLAACIEACFACAQACTACADACLGEKEHLPHLVRCIRLDLDCADICSATGNVLSRLTDADDSVVQAQLAACARACAVCADECERHASMGMEHCGVCAEACRRCAQACDRMLSDAA